MSNLGPAPKPAFYAYDFEKGFSQAFTAHLQDVLKELKNSFVSDGSQARINKHLRAKHFQQYQTLLTEVFHELVQHSQKALISNDCLEQLLKQYPKLKDPDYQLALVCLGNLMNQKCEDTLPDWLIKLNQISKADLEAMSLNIRVSSALYQLVEKVFEPDKAKSESIAKMLGTLVFNMFSTLSRCSKTCAVVLKDGAKVESYHLPMFQESLAVAQNHYDDFRCSLSFMNPNAFTHIHWQTIKFLFEANRYQLWVHHALKQIPESKEALEHLEINLNGMETYFRTDLKNNTLADWFKADYSLLKNDIEDIKEDLESWSDERIKALEREKKAISPLLDLNHPYDDKEVMLNEKAIEALTLTIKGNDAHKTMDSVVAYLRVLKTQEFHGQTSYVSKAVALTQTLRDQCLPKERSLYEKLVYIEINTYIESAIECLKQIKQKEPDPVLKEEESLVQHMQALELGSSTVKTPDHDELNELQKQALKKDKIISRLEQTQSKLQSERDRALNQVEYAQSMMTSQAQEIARLKMQLQNHARHQQPTNRATPTKVSFKDQAWAKQALKTMNSQKKALLAQGNEIWQLRQQRAQQEAEIDMLKQALWPNTIPSRERQHLTVNPIQQEIEHFCTSTKLFIPREIAFILKIIKENGGIAVIHGGFVRNQFLKKSYKDVDIAIWIKDRQALLKALPPPFQATANPDLIQDKERGVDLFFSDSKSLVDFTSQKGTYENALLCDDHGRIIDPQQGLTKIDGKHLHLLPNIRKELKACPFLGLHILKQSQDLSLSFSRKHFELIKNSLPSSHQTLWQFLKQVEMVWYLQKGFPFELSAWGDTLLTKIMPWQKDNDLYDHMARMTPFWSAVYYNRSATKPSQYHTLALFMMPLVIQYQLKPMSEEEAIKMAIDKVLEPFRKDPDVLVAKNNLLAYMPNVLKDYLSWQSRLTTETSSHPALVYQYPRSSQKPAHSGVDYQRDSKHNQLMHYL